MSRAVDVTVTELSAADRGRLASAEDRIEQGLHTFVQVGVALLEIRDSRLYREHFSTFEDYCRERWGFSRPRAYELMNSAEVAEVLSAVAGTAPVNAAQARELAPLRGRPDQLTQAWIEANETAKSEGRSVTARHLKAAARRHREGTPPGQPSRRSSTDRFWDELGSLADIGRATEDPTVARIFQQEAAAVPDEEVDSRIARLTDAEHALRRIRAALEERRR